MHSESSKSGRSYGTAGLLKIGGAALVLGAAAWLVSPLLFPVQLPPDFPEKPDSKALNASTRELIERTDREARRHPGSAETTGKLAMAYHGNLLYEPAAAAYRLAARSAPEDHRWVYGQAVLNEETGDEREQVKFLQRTITLQPDHLPALLKLGDFLFKGDRLEEAARHYEMAAKTADGSGALQAAFGLGRIAARRREWNKVIDTVVPATNSYPQAAPLYELLEEAYAALGQKDRAEQARQNRGWATWKSMPPLEDRFLDELTDLSYSSTRLLKQAGLLSRTGRPDKAVELARRASQVEPADPDVRNYLSRTLITFFGERPEAIEEAMTHLEECLRLRPSDPVPLGGFADDFFKFPKPAAATERLRALLRARSEMPGVHFFLGQAAEALGEAVEAEAEYRAALKANPNDSGAHNKLGLIAEGAGRFDEASVHFRKAIELNPMNTAARLNLSIELMQRANYQEGMKQLNELLSINPHDAGAHFLMGFAYLSMKRPEEAAQRFRLGLRYKPEDAEARFGLGTALAALGSRDQAAAELREALRFRPGHTRARELLNQLEN